MAFYLSWDLGVAEELRMALDIPEEARDEFSAAVRKVPQVTRWGRILEKRVIRQEQPDGTVIYKPQVNLGFIIPDDYELDVGAVLTALQGEIAQFTARWRSQHE